MKILSLNTWGGRAGKENLLDFFKSNIDIDIFCLQEVWEGGEEEALKWGQGIDTQMLTNLSIILQDHSMFFRPHYRDYYGLAMFVRNDLQMLEEGEIFVFKEKENIFDEFHANHARNLQYVRVETAHGERTILNFHGLWNGISKEDTEERSIQSDNISRFLSGISHPHVLTGDFNLLPDTKSLKQLEDLHLKNLIKEHSITSTRSSYYKKPVRFADYTLVSEGITVKDFKVLPDEVSDHLAMYLDFE